ncbi:MAG TPA: AAA family ATPase, partial [Blastocatellia bacterium]|nr:AAA family ATPase [Blastocatellia bacterium]
MTNANDNAIRLERRVLASILLGAKWSEARSLTVDHFLLGDHKKIFSAMSRLSGTNDHADLTLLHNELGDSTAAALMLELTANGETGTNLPKYVRQVQRASSTRECNRLYEQLPNASSAEEKREIVRQMNALLNVASTTAELGSELIVIRGDQVSEKALRYMWEPYLPIGKLVHIGGVSSQAKSPLTVDLAARVSTGADWPDGTKNTHGPRSVIMLNIEDDCQDTILPRFRLADGDKSKLYYVQGVRVASEATNLERMFTLEADMQQLVKLARTLPDLGLIVIDPVTNYLGSKKFIDEADVRSVLTPLANLAAELGIAIITVGHFNRREKGTDPTHRFMGAAAFVGVARAVYACGPDPEAESKYAHVMTTVRGCGGEGTALRYHTELVTDQCPDGETNKIIKVIWDGASDATAEDSVDPVSTKE